MGESHACGVECPNASWDEFESDFYCPILEFRKLESRKDVYQWLPAMLKCYWQAGIQSDDLEFLEAGNFMTSYRYEKHSAFFYSMRGI